MRQGSHRAYYAVVYLAAVLFLLIGNQGWAQQRPAQAQPQVQRIPGVNVLRNLDYGGKGNPRQMLDLYLPEKASDKPLPLVVWIHGGAWSAGNKDGNPAARMVQRGYASASIGYRLSQEAIFPAQINDCKAAIRYLRANARKYNLDADHIGVWGGSAGGHLVALLGTSGGVKELEGEVGGNLGFSSAVHAVVDFFGPTDVLVIAKQSLANTAIAHDAPDSPEAKLIGGPIQANKDKAAKVNPITYIAQGKALPPFLIMHGDKDNVVPLGQSQILEEALKKVGAEVTFKIVQGAGHGGHGFNSPENVRLINDFLDKHLKAQ